MATQNDDEGKDLGTYHVRVELSNGEGFWYQYETGGRFTHGTRVVSPLTASWMPPAFCSEEDLLTNIRYLFTEGDYSCDCNLRRFLDAAHQQETGESECGETLAVTSLSVRAPDGRMIPIDIS